MCRALLIILLTTFGCSYLFAVDSGISVFKDKQRLHEARQRKVDYFYYEGVKLRIAGKFDAAFDAFNYCLSTDSASVSAPLLFELANFYMQLNRADKAVSMLRQTVQKDSNNFVYRNALASGLLGMGLYGEAADEYRKLCKKFPENPEHIYYLAEALVRAGEIIEAIDAFNSLEDNLGVSEALTMQKYKLYMQIRDQQKAFQEIEKLVDKFPTVTRYTYLLGDLYLQNGDSKKAYAAFQKAHAIDPSDPLYIVSMADYYEVIGDKERALSQVKNALLNVDLEVRMKVSVLTKYIQNVQHNENANETIDEMFKKLFKLHPDDSTLRLMYGEFLISIPEVDKAKSAFEMVTEMDPNIEHAWRQLLKIAADQNDVEKMFAISHRCIELFPKEPIFYLFLGSAYFQQNKYDLSLKTYKKGLNFIPIENRTLKATFYGQIGDLYFQQEKADSSFMAYEESLKYDAENPIVLNNYSYYLALTKKDLKKAERMSAICVRLQPGNSTYLDTYAWIFFVQGNYSLAKVYMRSAILNDKEKSPDFVERYGDILYKAGEHQEAVEQWEKAWEMGKRTPLLEKKIAEKKYFEE